MEKALARQAPASRTTRWIRGIEALAIVLIIAALSLFVSGQRTMAASTYCGLHGTSSSIGGTFIYTDLAAYGDPGCNGTRTRLFFHRAATSPSTTLAYIGFEPSIGLRAWDCGNTYYVWAYGPGNVPSIGLFGQWSGSNSCGFQGDQYAKFVKSGYNDVWVYAYW